MHKFARNAGPNNTCENRANQLFPRQTSLRQTAAPSNPLASQGLKHRFFPRLTHRGVGKTQKTPALLTAAPLSMTASPSASRFSKHLHCLRRVMIIVASGLGATLCGRCRLLGGDNIDESTFADILLAGCRFDFRSGWSRSQGARRTEGATRPTVWRVIRSARRNDAGHARWAGDARRPRDARFAAWSTWRARRAARQAR
jgi:hypothetical protein